MQFSKLAKDLRSLSRNRFVCCRYRQSKYYDYDEEQPKNLQDVRNFTQIVWKDTRFMGIGSVADSDGRVYVVCTYNPPGNIDGEFQHNVLPATEVRINKNPFDSATARENINVGAL